MNLTAEQFKQYVGREPEEDDLERCNCEKAGQAGHSMCGWNSAVNLPVYMVGAELSEADEQTIRLQLNSRHKKEALFNKWRDYWAEYEWMEASLKDAYLQGWRDGEKNK